jgi:8-oxo-dGTP pyrophosphatase MutT (NUDIX family)
MFGAGVVIYQIGVDGIPLFLLLKSRWNEKKWSIPKGHSEQNESKLLCAIRELKEETGIDQNALCLIGNFKKEIVIQLPKATKNAPNGTKHYVFFLGRVIRSHQIRLSKEHSEFGWYTAKRAIELLPIEMKDVIRQALKEMNAAV